MKLLKILSLTLIASAIACGGSDTPSNAFKQPAGTVAINFTIDDTANKVFTAGQLKWKGSMIYDETTRKITKDSTWGGPWAPLYDDGPWDKGGHEPIGSVAGDNKWGVTVFAAPPASGSDAYEYGLIDQLYETNFGNGWIWQGSNGSFTVNAGATAAITAAGLSLAKFGDRDIQLVIDKTAAAAASGGPFDTSKITVKGSGWGWSEITLKDDGATNGDATAGDNKFTLTLSSVTGTGKTYPHTGLLTTGAKPEFIFVFNGKEYKDASGNANTTGITAGSRTGSTGSFTAATVKLNTSNKNTYIDVP